jgi:hypothetical protein
MALAHQLQDCGIRRSQGELSRLERGMVGEGEYTNSTVLSTIATLTNVDLARLLVGTL